MKPTRLLIALFALFLLSCSDAAAPDLDKVASHQDELGVVAGFANIALGRPTRQSSTLGGRPSSLVVDGNTDGNWYNGGVTHTNLDTEAWWEVDLGSMAYIEAVRVFGRTDCCQDRLSHYFVLISETPILANSPFTIGPANGYTPEYFSAERWPNSVPDTIVSPGSRKRGRYVRIYLPGPQFLSLAEVEVWGAVNLTEGQLLFPQQSSDGGFGAPAYRATDGNANGNFAAGSVTHTDHGPQSWWQIDLGAVHEIAAVDIWGRSDAAWDRLGNFYVMASETPFNSTNLLTTLNQPGVTWRNYGGSVSQWAPVTLNMNATGRYLRVQLESSDQYLSLAEVKIWGLRNLGLGATATQSTTFGGAVASRALDGNHDGNWYAPGGSSLTHTEQETNPLWVANFGKTSSLGLIRVWNRTDTAGERLNGFNFFAASGGTYVHPGAAGVVTDIRPMSIQNPSGSFPSISNIFAPTNQVGLFVPRFDYLHLAEVEMFGQPAAQCGLAGGHCCPEEEPSHACTGTLVCKYNKCQSPSWPAFTDYTDRAGNPANPADWAEPWTEDLQGVAHNATDWFFASSHHLHKIPLADDITNHGGWPPGIGQIFAAPGFHYGDPSYYQNVSTWADPIGHEGLLVPIETNDSANHYIALFNSSFGLLGLIGPRPSNLAWLAVNPADGLLYLPKSYTNMTQLDAYRIVWPTNGVAFDIIYVKTLTLHDLVGGSPILGNVQGGEFSSNGHLYVTAWNCYDASNGGIWGFDTNGNQMMQHDVNYVLPGACGSPSTGDELEGLDVVDLDAINPSYGGQLHLIKMDVTGVGNDDFHFMHVKVPPSVKYKL